MLSLMQMAKTSGALARHAAVRLPYISVLTNPTTAGVMASFASLGDVIIAEPKSMIGFAGPRVIKETTHQDLPEGFQTAEFLEEHGLIDLIVHRKKCARRSASSSVTFPPRSERGRVCHPEPRKHSGSRDPVALPGSSRWLYGTQRFGIKLGLGEHSPAHQRTACRSCCERGIGILPMGHGLEARATPRAHHPRRRHQRQRLRLRDDRFHLSCAGYRTGLFTSPHLVTFRERIQVNGEMISEDAVANGLTSIQELTSDWQPHPTFFEITTALALLHFREHDCELIVLETGLGGRLDATNAVEPIVSVITPIDYDHQHWLGNTLEEIAGEKAGIIKAKIPVVSAAQQPAAENVIRARAAACDAPIQFVSESYLLSPLALAGAHQKQNASLAIAALQCGGITVAEGAIARGLTSVHWPARFQLWDDRTIIDGAHNPSGAKILAQTWREMFGRQSATLILAVLDDKDVTGICRELAPISNSVCCQISAANARCRPIRSRKYLARNRARLLPTSIVPSFAAALDQARKTESKILITGSLHFAGEALAALQGVPAAYEECAQ